MTDGESARGEEANEVAAASARDSQCMRRFYDGDEGAFEELAQRWRPQLYRFFYRMGFQAVDADDLTQEVLVRLFLTRERSGFLLSRPLAPFLLKAARNAALQRLEKADTRARPLPLHEDQVAEAETSPLADDLFLAILDCARSLPEAQRVYLLLCGNHGLGDSSHLEISARIGKWPSEVSRLSQRTLRNLRDCLQKKGYRFDNSDSLQETE